MDAIGSPTVAARPSPVAPLLAAAAVVMAAWFLLQLWGLGAVPFHTKGEPREALVVWEMTHGGSWVLPPRNGVELPSKPPLFHWIGAVTSALVGDTNEFTIRFPSALASLLGAWMVCAAGAALWNVRAGVAAALVLLTCFEWARAATSARVDMTMTVALEAALLSFLFFLRGYRIFLIPFYLGIAGAILGKGPVGAALPAIICGAALILTRQWSALRRMHLLAGIAAVLLIGGSWYLLAWQEGGDAFFRKQILNENVYRMLGSPGLSGGHRHSIGYLFGGLLLGLLPWTLLLPNVVASIASARRRGARVDGIAYLLLWIITVAAFYSLPASKRSVYLLALYPPIALLLGWWWSERQPGSGSRLLRLIGAICVAISAAMIAVLALDHWTQALDVISTWTSSRDRAATEAVVAALRTHLAPTVALLLVSAASGAMLWLQPHPWVPFAALVLVAATSQVVARQIALPAIAQVQTARDLMQRINAWLDPGHMLFAYRGFDYGAVFYRGGHIPRFDGDLSDTEAPRYLLMTQKQWQQLKANAVHRYAIAESADGPLANSRLVLLQRKDGPG